jgi:hypothetical protein
MTYRKLSRAIAVVALGAAALIAFPASATAAKPVDEVGTSPTCAAVREMATPRP